MISAQPEVIAGQGPHGGKFFLSALHRVVSHLAKQISAVLIAVVVQTVHSVCISFQVLVIELRDTQSSCTLTTLPNKVSALESEPQAGLQAKCDAYLIKSR